MEPDLGAKEVLMERKTQALECVGMTEIEEEGVIQFNSLSR